MDGVGCGETVPCQTEVGAKKRDAGKSERKERKTRTKEGDGQAAGRRRFI